MPVGKDIKRHSDPLSRHFYKELRFTFRQPVYLTERNKKPLEPQGRESAAKYKPSLLAGRESKFIPRCTRTKSSRRNLFDVSSVKVRFHRALVGDGKRVCKAEEKFTWSLETEGHVNENSQP